MTVYSNLTDWRAYALARGDSAPTDATDPNAQAALQRASDYIRLRYVIRYGLDGTSDEVVEATHIAAGPELATTGFWSTTFTPTEIKTLTRLDVMAWQAADRSVNNYKGADAMQPVSPLIEALLAQGEGAVTPFIFAVGPGGSCD